MEGFETGSLKAICVTDCCTYVLVHNISLITDTQPLHHDKDWAHTQE